MKLRKVILTGLILSGSLLANTLGDATSLIEQMKTVSSEQRFELMNQIKSNILSLNNNDRTEALKQMRETSQGLREAKLARFKAGLSPEKLVVFEARLKEKVEAKKNYIERMANLSEEQKQEMRKDYKKTRKSVRNKSKIDTSGRTNRRGRVNNNSTKKRITSKTYSTVSITK